MNKNRIIILGFICLFIGFISIILSLVGLKLDAVGFLYKIGSGFAFLVHIILMCGGIALLYVGKNYDRRLQEADDVEQEA